jgi:hypothetical protein
MTENVNNKTTSGDIAHSLTKAGLGAIPVVGSLASEIFGLVVTPPLEKRRAEWMNEVAERLQALENNHSIDLDKLKDNEQFIDVVLQATTYALKTSEQDKIKAFKNAIVNTANGEAPDKIKSQIFLNQLDKFTTWHIKLLKFIDNPRDWFQQANRPLPNYMMGSISHVVKDAFPELKNEDELLGIIWDDLKTAGFHNSGDLRTTMSGEGTLSNRTTPFGKEFLGFISNQ